MPSFASCCHMCALYCMYDGVSSVFIDVHAPLGMCGCLVNLTDDSKKVMKLCGLIIYVFVHYFDHHSFLYHKVKAIKGLNFVCHVHNATQVPSSGEIKLNHEIGVY